MEQILKKMYVHIKQSLVLIINVNQYSQKLRLFFNLLHKEVMLKWCAPLILVCSVSTLKTEYGLRLASHIFVKDISPESLAARDGNIQEGDVVLKVRKKKALFVGKTKWINHNNKQITWKLDVHINTLHNFINRSEMSWTRRYFTEYVQLSTVVICELLEVSGRLRSQFINTQGIPRIPLFLWVSIDLVAVKGKILIHVTLAINPFYCSTCSEKREMTFCSWYTIQMNTTIMKFSLNSIYQYIQSKFCALYISETKGIVSIFRLVHSLLLATCPCAGIIIVNARDNWAVHNYSLFCDDPLVFRSTVWVQNRKIVQWRWVVCSVLVLTSSSSSGRSMAQLQRTYHW